MDADSDAVDELRPRKKHSASSQPKQDQKSSGIQEKPARAIHEHKAKMPPAVAIGKQVRRARAAVGTKDCGNFGYPQPHKFGFDYHLRSEFHPRRTQIHPHKSV